MRTVEMHEARTQLSELVDQAAKGEPFIIARGGNPLVQVTAVEPPRRRGFLTCQMQVPADFDSMGADAVVPLFEGD